MEEKERGRGWATAGDERREKSDRGVEMERGKDGEIKESNRDEDQKS